MLYSALPPSRTCCRSSHTQTPPHQIEDQHTEASPPQEGGGLPVQGHRRRLSGAAVPDCQTHEEEAALTAVAQMQVAAPQAAANLVLGCCWRDME